MKRIPWILCLGLCLGWGCLHAQVPGYLGKRTPISLNLSSFPAIRFSKLEDGRLPFNLRAGLSLEHVFSRRFSLILESSYLRSQFDYAQPVAVQDGAARLQGVVASLGARLYSFKRVGNIAPLGPYQQLELIFTHYQATDLDHRFYPDGRSRLAAFQDLGLLFSMGTQRIFHDHYTYTLGLQVGTVMGLFNNTEVEQLLYLKETATDRVQGYFFVNVRLGVGVLLF